MKIQNLFHLIKLIIGLARDLHYAKSFQCGVQGSNPSGGEIFRTRPDRPWGPPSLLYNWYRIPFPGVKAAGPWR
jgi:hypothetical protein